MVRSFRFNVRLVRRALSLLGCLFPFGRLAAQHQGEHDRPDEH
jgi:hypothetical protein